jgi:hypothetical protein
VTDPVALLAAASLLPVRALTGRDGSVYLERYTLADLPNGGHVYLHRFLRSDEDRELHSHPWYATATILFGSYREERRAFSRNVVAYTFEPGDVNTIEPGTFHRIDLLTPVVWTLFSVGPKVGSWSFWNRETDATTPWREFIRAKGLVPYEHPKGAA